MNTLKNICSNCRASLRGTFCHVCGQQANEPRRAVIGLVQDVFVDTLWIDSRLWRSILLLLWKPGVLARHYLAGKRVRYTPPFRMYLFASVFFFFFTFFLISVASNGTLSDDPDAASDFMRGFEEGLRDGNDGDDAGAETPPAGTGDPGAQTDMEAGSEAGSEAGNEAGADAGRKAGPEKSDNWLDREWDDEAYTGPEWSRAHVRRLNYAMKRVVDEPRLYVNSLQTNLPRVLLAAPLVYALLLALFYCYRRRFLFYDHLIVSLYMHAALYAYLLIALVLTSIPVLGWLVPILMIWPLLQPFAVLRQAYGSNWFSVVGKGVLLFSLYHLFMFTLILFGVSYALYQS